MATPNTPDPYNSFKDDDQRRRALNVREICRTLSSAAPALSSVLKPLGWALAFLVLYWITGSL